MSNMARLQGAGWRLHVEQHGQWLDTLGPEIDPLWTYTDNAGHEHHATALLVEKQDDPDDPPFMFDADGEEYNADTHLECKLCGEWITPGTWSPGPRWIPTHKTATLTLDVAGTIQKWAIWSDHTRSVIDQLSSAPDMQTVDVLNLIQEAEADGNASLVEIHQTG